MASSRKLAVRGTLLLVGVSIFFVLVELVGDVGERKQGPPEDVTSPVLKNGGVMSTAKSPTPFSTVLSSLNKTYVAVLQLDGQQGSGMRSLSVLQCMLGSFYSQFYVIEPYIGEYNVGTYMREGDEEKDNGMNFSSLFDFDTFNVESRKMSYPDMVTLDEYVKFSPKYVIYIIIAKHEMPSTEKVVWYSERNGSETVRCFDSKIDKLVQPYNEIVSDAHERFDKTKPQHCIVRIVELYIIKINDDNHFVEEKPTQVVYNLVFGKWSPQDISLLFTYYYNKLYVPVDVPLHGVNCLQRYANYEPKEQFKPSKRLLQDAKKYEDKFLGGRNRLAVMIRVERIVRYYLKEGIGPKKPKSLEECFERVLKVSSSLRQNHTDMLRPVVTLDVGRFGTKTSYTFITDKIDRLSKRVLSSLYDGKWSQAEWEASFFQVTDGETRGLYIAGLQRTLASRADCLILMGGGSFQALAVQDYFVNHSKRSEKCVHLVCVMTQRNVEVQKTMKNFQSS